MSDLHATAYGFNHLQHTYHTMCLPILLLVVLLNTNVYTTSAKPVETGGAAVMSKPFTLQCRNNSSTNPEDQAKNCNWTRNNKEILESNTNFDVEGFKLKIRRFIWKSEQRFTCSCISNRSYSFTITAEHTTSAKPVETGGAAVMSKPFTLQCRNNSSTNPEDQAKNCNWTRNNKEILESNTKFDVEGFKLKIRRFIWKSEQRFTCSCISTRSYSFTITAEHETNTGKLYFSSPLFICTLLALFCGVLALMVGCFLTYRGLGKRAMSKYQVAYITGRAEDPEAIEDHPGSEWDSESLKAPRSSVSGGVTDDCIYELADYCH